jgi:hypothetical protein
MACRKCGSSWTTIHGADRASCPECCKLQRCKDRASGRYKDPLQQKNCVICDGQFVATGLFEIGRKRCCSQDCQSVLRKRQVDASVAARKGIPGKPRAKKPRPPCAMCGLPCGSGDARKYCSSKCFHEARAAGIQSWDRSSIDQAARERPNKISQSPDFYEVREGLVARKAFLKQVRAMWRRAMRNAFRPPVQAAASDFAAFLRKIPKWLTCKHCGEKCLKPSSWKLPHCSWGCARKDCSAATCTVCDRPMSICFIGGNVEKRKANPVCNKCVLKRHKKACGDFKRRCRRFGVAYDCKIRRPDVFERDGYRCHICKRKTLRKYVVHRGRADPRSPTVDHHPYPLSARIRGHEWGNVRCACLKCNVKKGASWSGQMPLLFDAASG